MREVVKQQFYMNLTRKNIFLGGCAWFKFNNLGLALGMVLKFYTSVTKRLKLKIRKFWRLISTFVEVTGKKTGREAFMFQILSIGCEDISTEHLIEVSKFSQKIPSLFPVDARRRFNVYKTSIQRRRCHIDVL